MVDKLFVYGSLLKGAGNQMAQLLHEKGNFLGEGYLKGTLYKVDWFPAVVPDTQTASLVYGHIFHLEQPQKVLSIFDTYENYYPDDPSKSLYLRVQQSILYKEEQIECWVYVWNQSLKGLTWIPSGNYLEYLKRL